MKEVNRSTHTEHTNQGCDPYGNKEKVLCTVPAWCIAHLPGECTSLCHVDGQLKAAIVRTNSDEAASWRLRVGDLEGALCFLKERQKCEKGSLKSGCGVGKRQEEVDIRPLWQLHHARSVLDTVYMLLHHQHYTREAPTLGEQK